MLFWLVFWPALAFVGFFVIMGILWRAKDRLR